MATLRERFQKESNWGDPIMVQERDVGNVFYKEAGVQHNTMQPSDKRYAVICAVPEDERHLRNDLPSNPKGWLADCATEEEALDRALTYSFATLIAYYPWE